MSKLRCMSMVIALFALLFAPLAWGADLSGLEFCLDPGHGAYPTIKPFETIINLKVGFYLRDYLELANPDTVILTRTNNIQNPTLSEREYIANSNNVDWFNSIHHNAFLGTSNYTLVLYEELSGGQPEWPEAVTMSNIMADDLWHAMRTTHYRVEGDLSFLGYNLGVLDDLQMPGELTEASFFDYTPERNRLRNDDYLKMEARALFTSFLDYYDADSLTTGNLSGIVSDEETGEPVNEVICTLWPDSLVYTGDDSANGLYIFDDLTPGMYTVTVERTGYIGATDSQMVYANSFDRLDFPLVNTIPPTVMATVPDSGDTGVFVFDDIVVTFSRRMNKASTESALVIIPAADGAFSWDVSQHQMTFDPNQYLEPSTDYQVTIEATARDLYDHTFDGNGDGISGDPYTFSFRTARLDTTPPSVVAVSPVDQAQDVPIDVVISAEFDEFIDAATIIPQNVVLKDGASVPVSRTFDYQKLGTHGVIFIYPSDLLNPGETYTVTLNTGLQDMFMNQMAEAYEWSFTTSSQSYQFTSIDDFEDGVSPWWDPESSGSTYGTIADSSSFLTDTSVTNPITGSNASGRLDYMWDTEATSWLIRTYFPPPTSDIVHFDTSYTLQVWLHGDGSGNKFRFCVDDHLPATSADYHEVSPWVTIDWVGWRLVQWDLGTDSVGSWIGNGILEGIMRVDSFQMTYNDQAGVSKGTIYLDDLRLSKAVTGIEGQSVVVQSLPDKLQLHQNYPNPFNPETNISYQLAHSEHVIVRIFNVMGQTVRTLVDEPQPAGYHLIRWDGRDDQGLPIASGVYFCHLQAGHMAQSRKMILVR